jgi:hemerythrin
MTLMLPWNRACGVGVRAMNDRHAIMMDTMNELRLAMIRSPQRGAANDLLSKLVAFTRMHFQSEERLMELH